MKKILSVVVALVMCACLCAPAFAVDASQSVDEIVAELKSLDLSSFQNLTDGELAQILGIGQEKAQEVQEKLGLENLSTDGASTDGAAASSDGGVMDTLSGLLGGIDLSGITDSLSSSDALSSITDMFSGIAGGDGSGSGFDLSSLTDTISGAFSGAGFDLDSLTSGLDLGSFDISSVLGGLGDIGGGSGEGGGEGGAASGATDAMSGIMDGLMSGLEGLGLDTSMLDGLLDNDIVNFFANLYMGLGKTEDEPTPDTTAAPPVVTTTTPKTGDTSAVFVALGAVSVAACAAFVCLKKKKA